MPRPIAALLLALLCLFPQFSHAQGTVFLPTGEYRVSVTDLRIKVRNGVVVFERSWLADDLNRGEFRWHPNPAWDDLRFELDVIDGVPKTILRSGSRFERSGNGVYVFDRRYFVSELYFNSMQEPNRCGDLNSP